MAMTAEQKKATDAFKKKLDQSKKHIASGGSGSSWSDKGSGSSGGSSLFSGGGSYNPSTGIYTDSSGQKMSMASAPAGAAITFNSGGKISGGSSGGGSYNPSTGIYTDSSGQKMSMASAPAGASITAKTLTPGGQILTPETNGGIKPLSIEAYDPNAKDVYSQGYGSAIMGGISALGGNIKQFFTGKTHEYEDIGAGFDYVDLKRDRPTMIERHGTISDQDTGIFVTYGDIQKDIDVKKGMESFTAKSEAELEISDIQKKYQGQIDTGVLTLEEAETGFAKDILPVQEKFQTKISDIYEKNRDVPGLYTYGGTEAKKQLGAIADIGGFTIASALGGPLGAVGYGTARGISLAAKGDPKDIRTMDMGIAKLSPESKQAGLFLGMAGISAITAPAVIGKEITQLRISEGISSPSVSQPRVISKTNDVSRLITKSGQRTPYFETDTKTTFDIFKVGDDAFQIGSGSGKTTTRYLDFMKQGTKEYPWVSSTESFTLAGKGSVGGKAFLTSIKDGLKVSTEISGVDSFTGKLLVGTDEGFSNIGFGGTTKKVGEKAWFSSGGRVSGIKTYTSTDEAGTYLTGFGKKVIPKDISFGKDISLSISDDIIGGGEKGFRSFSGGGAKSSPQYFEQLYKTSPIEAIGGQATTEAMKVTTATIQTPKVSFTSPSVYAGLGAYETTSGGIIMEQMNAPQMNLAVGGLIKPIVDTLSSQDVRTSSVVIPGVSSMLIQSPIADKSVKQVPVITPIVGQVSGQKLIQKTDLKPVSEFGTPTITPTITPTPSGFGLPPIVPPYIPKLSLKLGKKGPTRKIGGIPEAWIGSSYAAKVFDIRSKKEAKGTFGGMFTGLEIKPLDLSGKARIRKKGTKNNKKR